MNFGAVVYRLKATAAGAVPANSGRLMHGALFALFHACSPDLAAKIHAASPVKPFTVSALDFPAGVQNRAHFLVRPGDIVEWRVTGFGKEVMAALLAVPIGNQVQVGKAAFVVESIYTRQEEHAAVGLLGSEQFIAACLSVGDVEEIRFDFLSPTSFRSFDRDYPIPLPDFLWGSLCSRWNQLGFEPAFDETEIRRMARTLLPTSWQGKTRRVYFGKDRGVLAFEGSFAYEVKDLPAEMKQIFFLLAQFAFFSGVGRLTGQGLGQVRVNYR